MEDSALRKIIEAENEVSGRIEREKKRIADELVAAQAAAAGKIEAARVIFERTLSDDLKKAEKEASEGAAELIAAAREYVRALASLDEKRLRDLVTRHLVKLFSGELL